jgi:hypothetical protein
MSETTWHRENCGPGRAYMLGQDPHIKYHDREAIVAKIAEALTSYLQIESAVRLTLDGSLTNAERLVIALPFQVDHTGLLTNFAQVIYHSLMGYYVSADPRTSHYGITNQLIEGNPSSLLRREIEKTLRQFQDRPDMAGRLIGDIEFIGVKPVPPSGHLYLAETIRKGLSIHVGYRLFATGDDINYAMLFIPLKTGREIIDLIYFNLERILLHHFVTYDESGDRYLALNETLIFKELEALLQRARMKDVTREKILQNLQFDIFRKEDTEEAESKPTGDRLYDLLNHIQDVKYQQASQRSRHLYAAYLNEMVNFYCKTAGKPVVTTNPVIMNEPPTPSKNTQERFSPPPSASKETAKPLPRRSPPTGVATGRQRLRPGGTG